MNRQCNIRARFGAMMALLFLLAGSVQAIPDIRISVEERGMYYVSADEIAAVTGLTNTLIRSQIAAGDVSLSSGGMQAAHVPADGGAGFYFFGDSVESQFADVNVYRLTWSAGQVMAEIADPGSAPVPGGRFEKTIHFEDATAPAVGYADGPDDDYWWWAQLSAAYPPYNAVYCTNMIYGVDPASTNASLTVWVRSVTESGVTNEHHLTVHVNGAEVGNTNWTGLQAMGIVIDFDPAYLNEGTNVFQVTAVKDDGVDFSTIYLDSFDLTYERTYNAVNGSILLKGGTNAVVTAGGFASSNIMVADISVELNPVLITNAAVDQTGGVYRASFTPESGVAEYAVFDTALSPVEIAVVEDSGLKSATNSAEYVIITPEEFLTEAGELAGHRIAGGLSVRIAVLDDIYDEFSYGMADPAAIKAFLGYAYTNWLVAPKYVVLAGSGTFDYKDYKGFGECVVPVKMLDLPWGLYASDGWFADMDGDRVPEMAVGRLPAMTAVELQRMIDRIISFETAPSERWQETVILAADNPDGGGDFHETSDALAEIVPLDFAVNKIHMTGTNAAAANSAFVSGINDGALLVNYFGHSGPDSLSDDGLLEAADVAALTNSNRLCLVTSWSCVMGRFAFPGGIDCLGEEFMLAETGGAVAVWAPSGQAFNRSSAVMAQALYQRIFVNKDRLLGDAVLGAAAAYSQQDMGQYLLSLYNLMGDPGMMIRGTRRPSDGVYSDLLPSFVDWKDDYFTEEEVDDVSVAGDFSDADGDGRVNLAEYVFGRNPTVDDGEADIMLPAQAEIPEEYDMALAFQRNKWVAGVLIKLMMSDDLLVWESADAYVVRAEVVDNGNQQTETVIWYVKTPDGKTAKFFRLKIE